MSTGIYKIINKVDGRYYIGSSYNIEKRWITHKSHLNNQRHVNTFLQRAWNKYGSDNFCVEIIENCDGYTRNDIYLLEQIYLNALGDTSYNLSHFANGGDNLTNHPNRENIINRIGQSVRGTYALMSDSKKEYFSKRSKGNKNGMFGRKHTQQSKQNISSKLKKFYLENNNCFTGKTLEEIFGKEVANLRKKKMSEMASQKIGEENSFYGKKHTAETCQTISKKRRGLYYGIQNKPIMIDGIYYKSAGEASKVLDIPSVTIRWRALSKNKKFDNYQYGSKND